MSTEEIHILFHSLGLDDNGHGREYRNHFATDPKSQDGILCEHLCTKGYMQDHGEQSMWGGMHCYCVTEQGKEFARTKAIHPRLTRSQKRYRAFLSADCGMRFGEWLKRKIAT
jgi:hypothetical protein